MEEKDLTVVEETQAEVETTVATEEEDEDEGSAIGGLIAVIGGGIALGVGATAFTLKVKDHFTKKRDERRKADAYDFMLEHCPDGFEVATNADGWPVYVKLEDEDEPIPVPPKDEEEK